MFRPLVATFALASALGTILATPAFAASDAIPAPAALRAESAATTTASSTAMTADQRQTYAAVFEAIRQGRWSDAQAGLAAIGDGVLTPVARAELFLAKNSPRVGGDDLVALLTVAPDLPQAPQLAALAKKRGLTDIPSMPTPHDLDWVDGMPRRIAARGASGDVTAASLAAQAKPLLKADKPADAEILLTGALTQLSPEATTEWQQRVAWSYYLNGDDTDATRLAAQAAHGAGDWSVQASWVQGLSAWRQQQCGPAEDAFTRVGANASDAEMRAAGLFWTARAEMACGRFDKVQQRLRAAARNPETFYGLIAARLLGIAVPASATAPKLTTEEWTTLAVHPDVRRAAALAEIGEYGLADEMLRWQAKIGDVADHKLLLHLAARLDLPATQIWLAHNCPTARSSRPRRATPRPTGCRRAGGRSTRRWCSRTPCRNRASAPMR